MQRINAILEFDEEQKNKYAESKIFGTGYLAYRDLQKFSLFHEVNFSKALDLGCGAGRSTHFLSNFCKNVSGIDISKDMLKIASTSLKEHSFYINNHDDIRYPSSPYTVIFSILMFFHFSNDEIIKKELKKCFNSLIQFGNLILINGTRNLYTKDYASVKVIGKPPKHNGDICQVKLKTIDCEIKDYFWSEKLIINSAKKCGFTFIGSHYPLGKSADCQDYKDEYKFPPYYYLAFKKI